MDTQSGESLIFEQLKLTDADALRQFYNSYATSFPHEDEREDMAATVWLMTVNKNRDIQDRFGPYQEFAVSIRRALTGEVVGGLWFGVVSSPEHLAAGFAASVQVYYLFLYKPWRKLLQRNAVMEQIRRYALTAFPPHPDKPAGDICVFFEANNPLRMEDSDIAADFDNSETDTYRRYASWLHFARPLDFNYVQPALDPAKQPVHFLTLFYIGPGHDVATPLLLTHLRVFISISVLKGHDARRNVDFQGMMAELAGHDTVSFIAKSHPDIREILAQAAWRSREAHRRQDPSTALHGPPLPLGRRKQISPSLCNAGYRMVYRLYHRLEHYHFFVTIVEAILGIGAIIASAAVFAFLIADLFNSKLVPRLLEMTHNVREEIDQFDEYILLFILLYIGSRGIVQLRRNQLGHQFGRLRRRVTHLDDGSAEAILRVTDWLKQELGNRAAQREAFGPMIRADSTDIHRGRVQALVASLSAQIYSDQVWRVVDPEWQRWENNALSQWLRRFPDGLFGAMFASCPGRTFFSLILPVVTPPRLTRLDLRHLEIDERYARRLTGRDDVPMPTAGSTYGPPTLLVLRLLMTSRAAGAPRSAALEAQVGLMLTGLLHIAVLLRRLANSGNVTSGLPHNTTILVVAANRQSADVLRWFGFDLLQRPTPHEEAAAADAPGEANLGVYRLVISAPADRSPQQHRFLDVLSHLLETIAPPH